MNDNPLIDLSDALGKALLQQFFEPVPTGRDPSTGQTWYAASGISIMAQQIYTTHATELQDEVWDRMDVEALAEKIAGLVVADLTRVPGRWDAANVHTEKLTERVLEIVAQQLGQRVVDQLDFQLGAKALPEATDVTDEFGRSGGMAGL
jgi:hypothetical protein